MEPNGRTDGRYRLLYLPADGVNKYLFAVSKGCTGDKQAGQTGDNCILMYTVVTFSIATNRFEIFALR